MTNNAEKYGHDAATFFSGEPGTHGREPFEDSTASGPGQQYSSTGAGAGATGGLTGQHHHHGEGHHATSGGFGSGLGSDSTTAGNFGSGGAVDSGIRHAHEGHSHHQGHHERQEHSHHTGGLTGGAPGSGTDKTYSGQIGQGGASHGLGGTSGLTGGAGSAVAHGEHTDRVGSLNQGGAAYERTTDQGPQTTGAAGTDRFDTDKPRSTGIGSDTTTGRSGWEGGDRSGAPDSQPKSGGLSGILGTSDKDFVNRDRKGEGAYHDDSGPFQKNTSGPGGNTALTGREGTFEKNPVAQAKTRDGEAVDSTTSGPTGAHAGQTDTTHKPSLLEKVKEVLL